MGATGSGAAPPPGGAAGRRRAAVTSTQRPLVPRRCPPTHEGGELGTETGSMIGVLDQPIPADPGPDVLSAHRAQGLVVAMTLLWHLFCLHAGYDVSVAATGSTARGGDCPSASDLTVLPTRVRWPRPTDFGSRAPPDWHPRRPKECVGRCQREGAQRPIESERRRFESDRSVAGHDRAQLGGVDRLWHVHVVPASRAFRRSSWRP